MPSYHFDIGNSTDGPIGFCARVNADTPEEALDVLKAKLPMSVQVGDANHQTGEYIEVYLNPEALTVDDIDEVDEIGLEHPIVAGKDW